MTECDFKPILFNNTLVESWDNTSGLVNSVKFIDALKQVPKFFEAIGGALKLGNSALLDKILIVEENIELTAKELNVQVENITLQDIIQRDIKHKWTHSGKKKRHATRNIIRLVWFLDFLVAFFSKLSDETKESTKLIMQECWDETLGPRQKFFIRKTTEQGLKISTPPTREMLYAMFDLTESEEKFNLFAQWSKTINEIAESLWTYFKQHKIDQVP